MIAQRQGMRALDGTYHGGVNGFDHVFQMPDGSITIVLDSKQIKDGATKLENGVGGYRQLSEKWIDAVIAKIPGGRNSPTGQAIIQAGLNGTLRTAVAGVDRRTRRPVMIPVQVP